MNTKFNYEKVADKTEILKKLYSKRFSEIVEFFYQVRLNGTLLGDVFKADQHWVAVVNGKLVCVAGETRKHAAEYLRIYYTSRQLMSGAL